MVIPSALDRFHRQRHDAHEGETRGIKGPRTFEASRHLMHPDNQPRRLVDHALTERWTVSKRDLRGRSRR